MKVLMANKYFFIKGGAENSFFETAGLLEKKGHDVSFFSMQHERNLPSKYEKYFVSNVDYDQQGIGGQLKAAGRILYSFEARRNLEKLLAIEKPDVAHLNNIYHQISPSIIHTLKKHGVPIVMTLRDYKLVCGSYAMVADGKICESCRGGKHYHCFFKKCVKDSRAKSLLSSMEMTLHHSLLKVYNMVDCFISPSAFLLSKVHDMGFKGRIEHLPNFTTITEKEDACYESDGKTVLYFGRISHEKGLNTLVTAFKDVPQLNLKVVGEGPLRETLEQRLIDENINNVEFCGFRKGKELLDEIKKTSFIALPSEWYENNPRSAIEAFALGKPAIGARIGGIPELVRDGQTGWTFESGNVKDLVEKLQRMASDSQGIKEMGQNARKLVEEELNVEKHYQKLFDIYNSVLA